MYATLDDLRMNLGRQTPTAEYAAKMLHRIPEAPVVDRAEFLLSQCKDHVVLDIGASGPMHDAIVKVAATCYGIDRTDGDGIVGVDLNDVHVSLPVYADVTLVICGEVLEHLSNPGWLLDRLRAAYPVTTIITVPNAFSEIARLKLADGHESVNRDHTCWFSWKTLSVLLERHGYVVKEFCWYNGSPRTAEGLIFVVEASAVG
jgi:hypothetical protein